MNEKEIKTIKEASKAVEASTLEIDKYKKIITLLIEHAYDCCDPEMQRELDDRIMSVRDNL